MNQRIEINTKNYFEGVIYALGWIFFLISPLMIFARWYLIPVFVILGILIITSKYKLVIYPARREIDDYLTILGAKTNFEHFRYSKLDYIYITRSRYTQQMNMESLSNTITGELFQAYLKSDADNHFLGESDDLITLREKVMPLARQLDLEIQNP